MLFISASQVKLFNECQRKWWFRYIGKVKTPQHPGAALGDEVHKNELGPYLLRGRDFSTDRPAGKIARAMAPLLPAPKTPGLVVEKRFEMPSPSGAFMYLGYIDLYAPDSSCVPGPYLDEYGRPLEWGNGGVPLLGDFKTTKNLDYALTRDGLRTDVQANLYAKDLMFELRTDVIDASWFYSRTQGVSRARRVHLRMISEAVEEQFQKIDEIGFRISAIHTAKPKVEELPPSPSQCDAYGGCPYRGPACNFAPPIFAASVNEEAKMVNESNDFFASLRKQHPAPATLPTMHPTQGPLTTRPAPGQVLAAPVEVAPGVTFEKGQVYDPSLVPPWATAPVDPSRLQPINPPESALPPAPPTGAAAPAAAGEAPKKRGRPPKASATSTTAGDAAVLAPDPAPVAMQVATRGITRGEAIAMLQACLKILEAA